MGLIRRHGLTARGLAARRRNAPRSTGPRTGWGKARVSLNALRHGERSVHFRPFLGSVGLRPKRFFLLDRVLRLPSARGKPPRSAFLNVWLKRCWAEVTKWQGEAMGLSGDLVQLFVITVTYLIGALRAPSPPAPLPQGREGRVDIEVQHSPPWGRGWGVAPSEGGTNMRPNL